MQRQPHRDAIITVSNVGKTYGTAPNQLHALRDVDLVIPRGRMVSITGRSGSGKSTLLNLLTGIDRPTRGLVTIDGASPGTMSERELAEWRGRSVGIVFQFFQLLPTLTVLENVILPMDFCGTFRGKERERRATELLRTVGVADQSRKFPSELSGGQQQRVAIARALANDPPIVVADEPTGNLDSENARAIFALFRQLTTAGKTIVVVTHETEFAELFDARIELADGRVVDAPNEEGLSCVRNC
jgi:putative ABC transport system ATP-binding protein